LGIYRDQLAVLVPSPPAHTTTLVASLPVTAGVHGVGWPGASPSDGFVKIADLHSLGFGERFSELATDGFPGAGSYMGSKASIGL
jgi:hypothetical protein